MQVIAGSFICFHHSPGQKTSYELAAIDENILARCKKRTFEYHRSNDNRARNTSPKTKKKWTALRLGRERWSSRETMAKQMVSKRPKLFQSKKKCGATRDVIFSVYNYDDASTLYAFMRSLREAGSTTDVPLRSSRATQADRAARCVSVFFPSSDGPHSPSGCDFQALRPYNNLRPLIIRHFPYYWL